MADTIAVEALDGQVWVKVYDAHDRALLVATALAIEQADDLANAIAEAQLVAMEQQARARRARQASQEAQAAIRARAVDRAVAYAGRHAAPEPGDPFYTNPPDYQHPDDDEDGQ